MKHVLYIAITLFLITTYPMVSRVDAADPIPYEELVGVWTYTQNGFDHNLTEDRVLELCKTVISTFALSFSAWRLGLVFTHWNPAPL